MKERNKKIISFEYQADSPTQRTLRRVRYASVPFRDATGPTLNSWSAIITQENAFSIFHFRFFICHRLSPRLESGLVRLVRRGTSALSKRRVENFLDDVKMTNEKWKMENAFSCVIVALQESVVSRLSTATIKVIVAQF